MEMDLIKEERFNKLSAAEEERLHYLIEECSEVIKCCTKILRHGYDSKDPTNLKHPGNRTHLEIECSDVIKAFNLMIKNGDIKIVQMNNLPSMKYFHHQGE